MMASFAVVHSITSPYRLHLFRTLDAELRARGLELHVHFMTRSFEHRPPDWQVEADDLAFPHTFWSNVGPTVRGKRWHLNPRLVVHLARRPPEYLLVGGPWDSLTGMLASVLARRTVGVAWWEANTQKPGRVLGVVGRSKRFLLGCYRVLAVPGEAGRAHAKLLLNDDLSAFRVAILPNIVDESRFRPATGDDGAEHAAVRRELGVAGGDRIAIWPTRLLAIKGVLEFLSKLTPADLEGWSLVILGEGPLRDAARTLIAERGLGERVRLPGSVPRSSMPAVYRAAELFVLPSLRDANPLSVVEALHSGLPILVSNRVGNRPEALRMGENGWGIEPDDTAEVRAAVQEAFGASSERLAHMGRVSRALARDFWSSRGAVRRFLDAVPVG